MLFPSNKTIASEGGAVPTPGVTILGLGSHISVVSGFVKSFLRIDSVCADKEQNVKHKEVDNRSFIITNNLILKKHGNLHLLRFFSKLYPIQKKRFVDV
jgi:hypothetical protein